MKEYIHHIAELDDHEIKSLHSKQPYDDWREFDIQKTPLVLYRSVSPGELNSIFSMGKIEGGQNKFNEFDPRRLVFFASKISDSLIWQGEDVERQAQYSLRKQGWDDVDENIKKQFDSLKKEQEEFLKNIGTDKNFGSLSRLSLVWILRDNRIVGNAAKKFLDQYEKLNKKYSELTKWHNSLNDDFRKSIKDTITHIKDSNKDLSYSSAIIETRPIKGARVYHGNFSSNEAEYGFLPGQVKLTDIEKVHFVKDRKVIKTVSVKEADDILFGDAKLTTEAFHSNLAMRRRASRKPSRQDDGDFTYRDFSIEGWTHNGQHMIKTIKATGERHAYRLAVDKFHFNPQQDIYINPV